MAANDITERIALLTLVCESQWFSSMSTVELKLYLLLLVSAVGIDREGQIAWEVLKRGLGESLTADKIALWGEILSRYGLAKVRVTYPPEAAGYQRGDAAPVVFFTVSSIERLKDPALRGPRHGQGGGDV